MIRSSKGRLFLGWWVSFCGGRKLKTTKQAASLFDGNPGVSLFSLAWIGLDFSMIRKTEKNPNNQPDLLVTIPAETEAEDLGACLMQLSWS